MMVLDLTTFLSILVLLWVAYFYIYKCILYPCFLCPLRHLPGPRSNLLNPFGHFKAILYEEATAPHYRWFKEHGPFFMYRGIFNRPRVVTIDPGALQRILGTHSEIYERSPELNSSLMRTLGKGLLTVMGKDHKRQRTVMSPAFHFKNIQALVPLFAEKAFLLKKRWDKPSNQSTPFHIDVCPEFSKLTLDIIGSAGFGYEFNSLQDETSELNEAYASLLSQVSLSVMIVLEALFPILLHFPSQRTKRRKEAMKKINEIVDKLIMERKHQPHKQEKDILGLAVAANEAAENKLDQEELRGQVMTFLAAGHETTSVALSWSVYFLAKYPQIQQTLFQDIQTHLDVDGIPTWNHVQNDMTYLNKFIKEVLRCVPPVPITNRVTTQDDELCGHFIPKGTAIFIVPGLLHRLPHVWGPDAFDFNPDRWESNQDDNTSRPYGSYIPFLLGPRNCIGHRLALTELKTVLAILVRHFEFSEIQPGDLDKVKKKLYVTWKADPGVSVHIIQRHVTMNK